MPPPWAALPVRSEYAHYDLSNRDSVTPNPAGSITRVKDLSGNGLDATNVGTVNTGTLNGLPTANFPAGTARLVNTAFSLAQPSTYVGAFKSGSAAASVVHDGVTARSFVALIGSWFINAGTNVFGGTADTNAHVFVATFNGASSTMRIDGTLLVAGNPGAGALVSLALGNAFDGTMPLLGDIGQWAAYPGVLATADVFRLEAFLTDKWLIAPSRIVVNNPLRPVRRRRRASGLLVPDHDGLVLPKAA